MTATPIVGFRPLTRGDLSHVTDWFAEPEVARWWNVPADLASVTAKYLPRIEGSEPTSMWIAEIDGDAAGLLQSYLHIDYPVHDACVGIPAAVGIDYLLGGAHRGRGLAPAVLGGFARHALGHHPSAAVCVATPAQSNVASWRSLERAGFARFGTCRPPDEPAAYIYVLERGAVSSERS